jgi:hypothetical protein
MKDPDIEEGGGVRVVFNLLRKAKRGEVKYLHKCGAYFALIYGSIEFRHLILNSHFQQTKGLTNAEIYKIIVETKDPGATIDDKEFDFWLTVYNRRLSRTIAYTYPSTLRVWLNRKFFRNTASTVGTLAHEDAHNKGFHHHDKHTLGHSVPYKVGAAAKYLAERLKRGGRLTPLEKADAYELEKFI